jgi:DNA-binding transcriptional regulator YhcF (GntR family)
MAEPRELIVDVLRGRVLRGLQAGTLRTGERLPSARELAGEFGVDYRLVIAAYRDLAEESLVELRPRGGVYVAARPGTPPGMPPLPDVWLADVLTQGLAREIPGTELHEWLRRCTETLRLRCFVVASTADQVHGLCRELRDDFGLEADGMTASEVREGTDAAAPPLPLRRADLVVTTAAHARWLGAAAAELRKPIIVVDVRPDLLGGEWALLLRRPVYAIVATPEFGEMLRRFYAQVPGIENLRLLVHGRDDLGQIPEDAPTYVTQRVRAQLGDTVIRGRVLPAARTIAVDSARALFAFIVRENIDAMARLGR